MLSEDIKDLSDKIAQKSLFVEQIHQELGKSIIGQRHMLDRLMIGLLCNGHILLEGLPGLAKTQAIKALSAILGGKFSRIQFTPDLLPADIIGTMIYNQQQNQFQVRKGPIFANFVLADEINRAPAKVQSALLEAMQEKQVTIGEQSFKLQEPFIVMATQNPIEQEGTYNLPEAQSDRFLLKVVIDYPKKEEEQLIIRQNLQQNAPQVKDGLINMTDVLQARDLVKQIYMDEKIEKYILDIVFATRYPKEHQLQKLQPLLQYGASPRASIALALSAKACAFMKHRAYVVPEDVRSVAMDVLRHRIGLTYEAEAENIKAENIVTEILNTIEVP